MASAIHSRSDHVHTEASFLTIAPCHCQICLPNLVAHLVLASSLCDSIDSHPGNSSTCHTDVFSGNVNVADPYLPASGDKKTEMSGPWKLLPVSTFYGLPSQSNSLRTKQICLSRIVWINLTTFTLSTNDACLIQDPGIWCRNRTTCHLFNYIILIWWIFCFPKINYLFIHGIILCRISLFMCRCCFLLWLIIMWRFFFWRPWTSWWGRLLFPLTVRFLSLQRASCTSWWLFIWFCIGWSSFADSCLWWELSANKPWTNSSAGSKSTSDVKGKPKTSFP